MRTFAVTGGAGFIGSHIAKELVGRGHTVRVIDNLVTGHLANLKEIVNDIEFFEADICDPELLAHVFSGVDCVFHKAALASVPLSVAHPIEVNHACVTGTLNVLNEARKAGVRRVVYAGSSSCYGDRPYSANRESDVPMPISPYAADFCCVALKLVVEIDGEHHRTEYGRKHDQRRDRFLAEQGYEVVRIEGYEAVRDVDGVRRLLENAISIGASSSAAPSPPAPLPQQALGEGSQRGSHGATGRLPLARTWGLTA